MPEDEFLRLTSVTKRHGGVVALDGVSFVVHRGEVFGYIGPSGAGKTTTIKIMVGLIRGFSGTVTLDGGPSGMPSVRCEESCRPLCLRMRGCRFPATARTSWLGGGLRGRAS